MGRTSDPPATAAARAKAVLRRILLLGAALLAALAAASYASAATFTVTTTADTGAGSLRQAILDSNGAIGPDTIDFNIAGSGPHVIQPVTALPQVTDHVTIDGSAELSGPAGRSSRSTAARRAACRSTVSSSRRRRYRQLRDPRARVHPLGSGNGAGLRLGGVGGQ